MSCFWKLFGYKSFVVNVGDYVRLEQYILNETDCRKKERVYDIVQIKSIVTSNEPKKYNYKFVKYSPKIYLQNWVDYSTIYYTNKWGGMKPLTEEDKLELL